MPALAIPKEHPAHPEYVRPLPPQVIPIPTPDSVTKEAQRTHLLREDWPLTGTTIMNEKVA